MSAGKCPATDAASVLNSAGYIVVRIAGDLRVVQSKPGGNVSRLPIVAGYVNNAEVTKLLEAVKPLAR